MVHRAGCSLRGGGDGGCWEWLYASGQHIAANQTSVGVVA